MALGCKVCVFDTGITIKDLFNTQDELNEHLEAVHHMPVIRGGETKEQAITRFLKNHPEAITCPECIELEAEWAIAKWTKSDKNE